MKTVNFNYAKILKSNSQKLKGLIGNNCFNI